MRQKPIEDYIVDFFCSKLGLIIEIDGESHDGRFHYDAERQKSLESTGLTVLRFNDAEVKSDMTNVLMAIEGWIENRVKQPPLSPFVKGESTAPCPPFLRGNNPLEIRKNQEFTGRK